jgi:hypothetical protein
VSGGSSGTAGTALGGATSSGGSPPGSGGRQGIAGSGGLATAGSGGQSDGGRGPSAGRSGAGASGAGGSGAGGGGAGGSAGGGTLPNAGSGGGSAGGGTKDCPFEGAVSYSLSRAASPSAQQTMAYDKITAAMDKALGYYNCYTDITKALRVSYEPSVPTADGNVNGSIRFGSSDSMNYITAMHEIGHTVGVGSVEFNRLIEDGVFTGPIATAKLRELTGDASAELHGDTQHFWPYGLNFTSEVKSEADLLNHCALVVAMRADMGL